jgi:hypothetical protein
MYALTLTAPWGSLIAIGATHPRLGKRIETRSWALPTAHMGQPLAIHQAAGLPHGFTEQDLIDTCALPYFREALAAAGITSAAQLPRGAIVAVATPTGSHPTAQIYARDADDEPLSLRTGYISGDLFLQVRDVELSFGNYGFRRFAWPLGEIAALAVPVPCRGGQRLWRVPAAAEAAVRAQLPA